MPAPERYPPQDIAVGILPDGHESPWTTEDGCLSGQELAAFIMLCLKPTPVEVRVIRAGSLDQPYKANSV